MSIVEDFDTTKYYLGSLCSRKHDYKGTGQSLKRISSSKCVECDRAYYKRYRAKNSEKIYVSRKLYDLKNRDKLLDYKKQYYLENRDKLLKLDKVAYQESREEQLEYARNYYQKNRDRIRLRSSNYAKNNPDKVSSYRINRRARKAQCYHDSYTSEQLSVHFSQWDNRCAYCDSSEKPTVDHFIPISKKGAHALHNIVPACCSCNCSKQNSDAWKWYSRQSFYSIERWRKIEKILQPKNEEIICVQLSLFDNLPEALE